MKKAKALVMSLLLVVIMTASALPTAAATVSENWAIAEEEGLAKASCNHAYQPLMNCTYSNSTPIRHTATCTASEMIYTNWLECKLCGSTKYKPHSHGFVNHQCSSPDIWVCDLLLP